METLIDSGSPSTPAHYVGIPWGLELYTAISKRPDATLPLTLPPVLTRLMFDLLTSW